MIVGLAPGLRGANRTGRPFTGDYAGDLLYSTLIEYGFAEGTYRATPGDDLTMVDAAIVNSVRCVPPENKPLPAEINTCRQFLIATIAAMPNVKAMLALGRIAHDSALPALGLKRAAFPFGHGAMHEIGGGKRLYDSYHCSRYNTNTGVLTPDMFRSVFANIRAWLGNRRVAKGIVGWAKAEGRAHAGLFLFLRCRPRGHGATRLCPPYKSTGA
jgi:uracil-DNA glycosylase